MLSRSSASGVWNGCPFWPVPRRVRDLRVMAGHVAHCRTVSYGGWTRLKGRCREEWGILIRTSSAQEAFYRLSAEFKEDYLESDRLQFLNGVWLHPEAKLGSGVQLAPGAVIGNCVLGG